MTPLGYLLRHLATAHGSTEPPYSVGQQLLGHRWTVSSSRREESAFQVIIGYKEILDLLQALWPQVFQGLERRRERQSRGATPC
jgi:hypothetical protein